MTHRGLEHITPTGRELYIYIFLLSIPALIAIFLIYKAITMDLTDSKIRDEMHDKIAKE